MSNALCASSETRKMQVDLNEEQMNFRSVHTFPALLLGLVDGVSPYPEEYKKRVR